MGTYSATIYDSLVDARTAADALSSEYEVEMIGFLQGSVQKVLLITRLKHVLESMELTDVDGTNTVVTADDTEGGLATGIYTATAAGAGSLIFYPDWNGTKSFILTKIGLICTAGAVMSVKFVYKPLAAWVDAGALAENYSDDENLVIDAAHGAKWTYLGPFDLQFSGIPFGISVTVDKACTVYMQVQKEA
jgi:hypothetical protein